MVKSLYNIDFLTNLYYKNQIMTSNSTHLSLTKVFQNLLEVITLNLSKRDSKLYQKKPEILESGKVGFV